jgi:ATP-dependent DNA ligase
VPSLRPRYDSLNQCTTRLVQKLPEGNEWLYEVKLDGYRCLAGKGKHQATLWSRREKLFTNQFPRIARVCEKLMPDTLLDGEIVALDKNGRPSFNLLQHHRSQASVIHYYTFDLLIYRGKSLHRDTPILKADLGRAFQARYNGSSEVALEAALDRLLAIMQVLVAPECSEIQIL